MTNLMRYQLEQTNETATLYLRGALGHENVPTLVGVCDSLPTSTRTLRLDLRSLGILTSEGLDVVRRLLNHWRSSRCGEFRLTTSHLLATCRPVETPVQWAAAHWPSGSRNEALTGTFL